MLIYDVSEDFKVKLVYLFCVNLLVVVAMSVVILGSGTYLLWSGAIDSNFVIDFFRTSLVGYWLTGLLFGVMSTLLTYVLLGKKRFIAWSKIK